MPVFTVVFLAAGLDTGLAAGFLAAVAGLAAATFGDTFFVAGFLLPTFTVSTGAWVAAGLRAVLAAGVAEAAVVLMLVFFAAGLAVLVAAVLVAAVLVAAVFAGAAFVAPVFVADFAAADFVPVARDGAFFDAAPITSPSTDLSLAGCCPA